MLETHSEEETELLGERLGNSLQAGDFVALSGALGAGKTALVRGIARGLGIYSGVSSPTYTLVMEHTGRVELFHFDVYRISGGDALEAIGFDDYVERNGVIVMEWPENVLSVLPQMRISISIGVAGENARQFTISAPKDMESALRKAVGE